MVSERKRWTVVFTRENIIRLTALGLIDGRTGGVKKKGASSLNSFLNRCIEVTCSIGAAGVSSTINIKVKEKLLRYEMGQLIQEMDRIRKELDQKAKVLRRLKS